MSHQPTRINGPYRHGQRWRIVIVDKSTGASLAQSFASESEAQAIVDAAREIVDGRTIMQTLDAYDAAKVARASGRLPIKPITRPHYSAIKSAGCVGNVEIMHFDCVFNCIHWRQRL